MKKLIFLLVAAGFIMRAQAQNQPYQSNQPNQSNQPKQSNKSQQDVNAKDVPNSVTSAFNSAYPNVSDVKWKRDGNNYKANYEAAGNKDVMVVYDASGNLVKTKMEIESSQLPSAATEYVSRNYNKDDVKEAYRITEANGTIMYKAEVKGMYLIFDSQGNFVRSEKKDQGQPKL